MKNALSFLVTTLCCVVFFVNAGAQTNTTGYYPLKIKNRATGSSNVKHVYLIMTGQKWDKATTNCVLSFAWSATKKGYVGSLQPITATTTSAAYSYAIDSLPNYNSADSSVVLYIPHLQSGRCMVSLNYTMSMSPVQGTDGSYSLAEPNINSTVDPNTGILFDKFEFSYDTTGATGTFYIDPTAVDFFAIPISLSLGTQQSGSAQGAKRDALMSTMQSTLKKYDQTKNHIWDSLAMYDVSNTTILRLAAPYLAPNFDTTYLRNKSKYGISYIDALIDHYKSTKHVVIVDCSELNEAGEQVFDSCKVSPATDPGAYLFYGVMSSDGKSWTFTNNPKVCKKKITQVIYINQANSYDFFAPGVAPFATPDETVESIIVRQLTSAFTVGLLPAPDSTLLGGSYFSNSTYPFYALDTLLPGATNKNGPWYNLYTRAIHSAVPQLYAFAFDDELGQSGTLTGTNPADTATVTIGSMGSTVVPTNGFKPAPMPATAVSWTGFKKSGKYWVSTATWSSPPGQIAGVSYYWMLTDANFIVPADSLIALQLATANAAPGKTTTIRIPVSYYGSNTPSPQTQLQVIVCGGNVNCPTVGNVFIPNGPATSPVSPTKSKSKKGQRK